MLSELRIRNVGVIDDVTLELGAGLTVLTGETGAGKTMVVSALELLLGARADADQVRAGTSSALVEGCLAPPPPGAAEWLEEGDNELIVSREVAAAGTTSGRSRARLGGRMAPVSALTRCVGQVVELHGQSDSSRLALPAVQRDLLDRFGGAELADVLQRYRDCYEQWAAARAELDQLRASARDRAREADRLRYEIAEIDAVLPQPGEAEALAADLERLEHAEVLGTAAAAAAGALADEGGAHDALAAAAAALQHASGHDPQLDALAQRLVSLTAEAAEAGMDLRRYGGDLEVDPRRLEVLRQRHAELVRLSRKYGEAPQGGIDENGLITYGQQARDALQALDAGDERVSELEGALQRLGKTLTAAVHHLHDERVSAAKHLEEVVQGHLAELAMTGARLDVAVEPIKPAAHGADRVTFLLAANPGEPAMPFAKAASGGERSRVALSLRLALADADRTPVLVFDEVDAGIGGATALEVGRKLASLAQGRQVLCVTHLAQLAAHADAHFRVEKHQRGDRTVAEVRKLEGAERVGELSRMLSGSTDGGVAAEHAAQMLSAARARR